MDRSQKWSPCHSSWLVPWMEYMEYKISQCMFGWSRLISGVQNIRSWLYHKERRVYSYYSGPFCYKSREERQCEKYSLLHWQALFCLTVWRLQAVTVWSRRHLMPCPALTSATFYSIASRFRHHGSISRLVDTSWPTIMVKFWTIWGEVDPSSII